MTNRKSILGVGNALVDVLIRLNNDDLLDQFGLAKGSMTLVDADLSATIQNQAKDLPKELQTGGSAANTIHGISRLGGACGYIGKISDDEMGQFFKSEFERNNIQTHLFNSATKTGVATALVSPDSERTFGTYLGAAMELNDEEITEDIFSQYGYIHIEGYLVQNHALVEKIAQLSKNNGLKVAIDMASFNIVEANLNFLKNIINNYVDIVFANEEEAKSLTGLEPKQALDAIAEMSDIAVVKIGPKGSMIKHNGKVTMIDCIPNTPIDTTGAGDIYASGFLYGLAEGYKLEQAGNLGSLLSGKVVEVMGAKLPDHVWNSIKGDIDLILGK